MLKESFSGDRQITVLQIDEVSVRAFGDWAIPTLYDPIPERNLPESLMVTTEQSRNPLRLLMRVPVPWVFVIAYLLGVLVEKAWPIGKAVMVFSHIRLVGAVVFVIGALIAAWGLVTFRTARTTTVPGELSSQLVTWGPYRFTRNPMYVGLSVAYLGEAGILVQVWPLLFLPLTIAYLNWMVIPVEESRLREVFGDDYKAYQQKVRRWL